MATQAPCSSFCTSQRENQIVVMPGAMCVIHLHHRDPARADKSQWIITSKEERDVFRLTVQSGYVNATGWGLHTSGGGVQYLGHARDLNTWPVNHESYSLRNSCRTPEVASLAWLSSWSSTQCK